jgi:peroxiredoxin
MKKVITLCYYWLLTCSAVKAEGNIGTAHFKGRILSDADSIQLKAVFNGNFITGEGEGENVYYDVPIDKNGYFAFSIDGIEGPGRIMFYDKVTFTYFFSSDIVEPNDNIVIDAKISDGNDSKPAIFNVLGYGSEKYNIGLILKTADNNAQEELNKMEVGEKSIDFIDSILYQRISILDQYKNGISENCYQLLKADIVGKWYKTELYKACGYLFIRAFKDLSLAEIDQKKLIFDEFVATRKIKISPTALALSPSYTEFEYQKAKCKLALENHSLDFPFIDLYKLFRAINQDEIRDKLLVYCLSNGNDLQGFFKYVDAHTYSNCLKDAASIIKTPWLKRVAQDMVSTKATGAEAFNFILPADSSDHLVSLSDLRGKVLLVDIWAYQCAACVAFTRAFHEKVYSFFKNDSNFAVVSILGSQTTKEKYMFRLRSLTDRPGVKVFFTYPDYINLFGGEGVEMGRKLCKHYSINAFPMVFLINKKGKIFSIMVPFVTDTSSPNVEKLRQLIKDALAES